MAGIDTLGDQIERLLDGSGGVLRLLDPDHTAEEIDESAIPEGFTGVLVSTSGSTGTPKTVMLSRSALMTAAHAAHARLGGPGAWVNPLPPKYVAGLMTQVRAIVGGHVHHQISPHMEDLPFPHERAYLSLVPAQLHRGLSDTEIRRKLAAYEAVLVGGAALDETLRDHAGQAGVRVVTTYGMSETCGGVVYDGIPLDNVHARFLPIDVSLSHMDETDSGGLNGSGQPGAFGSDHAHPQLTEGRILLDTPTAFDGYLGDPQATARTKSGNVVRTSDRGRMAQGRLQVLGRVDDVVQSGGTNVDLAEIQRLLDESFPHLTACFAVPDPVWGATVILATTGPGLEQVMDGIGSHLESAARPRGILRLEALPRTSSGKIDRETLVKMWRNSGERA